jgi:heat shock protein HslJ
MKKILVVIVLIVVVIVLAKVFDLPKNENVTQNPTEESSVKNITYVVNGETFLMVDGKAQNEISPNSATKNTLSIFGEPAEGDLNSDGVSDFAVLLQNQPGGTGVFYYAVLVVKKGEEYVPSETMLLGDRIAPQNIEIKDGRAVYNFADRKAGEPMSTAASIAKSVWVHYDKNTNEIGEWVKDFEGEANPEVMKLDMKKWIWQSATIDGKEVNPKDSSKFTIEFKKDGTFGASTDCNGIGGNYSIKDKQITFSDMMGTLMYCEGSQEDVFKGILENAESYYFTSKGELKIELKNNKGLAIFN